MDLSECVDTLVRLHIEHFRAVAIQMELSHLQAVLLWKLEPGTPVPMNAAAERMSCDPATITGVVDVLEARGIVERQPLEGDRRVKLIALTGAGEELRHELLERLGQDHPWISELTEQDKEALLPILRRTLAQPAWLAP